MKDTLNLGRRGGQDVCPDDVPKVSLGFEAAFAVEGQTLLSRTRSSPGRLLGGLSLISLNKSPPGRE